MVKAETMVHRRLRCLLGQQGRDESVEEGAHVDVRSSIVGHHVVVIRASERGGDDADHGGFRHVQCGKAGVHPSPENPTPAQVKQSHHAR